MSSSDLSPRAATHPASTPRDAGQSWYNAVWRWHFYAGLFCMPFVVWLAMTGSVYLWRPQIEAWLDRPYDQLSTRGAPAAAEAQVAAALAAVPGSTLHRYILPQRPDAGTRILVTRAGEDQRVIVDPRSLAVLDVAAEEQRPMRLLFHLHGELLAGALGSYLVEAAACWAVVMLVSGIYLWWPRGRRGIAGVLYPRLRSGPRVFWRDLHACAGLWVSAFALVLILTGLPWAKGWGSYLGEIRTLTGTAGGQVDWTIGGKMPKDDGGAHVGHHGMTTAVAAVPSGELDRVVAAARRLALAPPVTVTPPTRSGAAWRVASDAADRPLRGEARIDGRTGAVLGTTSFAQRQWIDRLVGYGVAVHEGALFGLANQILGTLTALLLVVLAISGAVMWWRRRPSGLLGAPTSRRRPRFGLAMVAGIGALAIYMPMFGTTLAAALAVEGLLLRRLPRTRVWLGLPVPAAPR